MTTTRAQKGDVILEVSGLKAKVSDTGEEILKGVDLIIRQGETHAIMGKKREREINADESFSRPSGVRSDRRHGEV